MGASLISGTRGSNGHTGHQSLLLGSVPSVHLGFRGAYRDSTGFGALDEGLISS